MRFESNEDTNSVLCGFTITGGTGTNNIYGNTTERDGGGVMIKYSGAKIEHNIIRNNILQSEPTYHYGAGIMAFGGTYDDIVIRNNIIKYNKVIAISGWGAGAGLGTKGYILFEDNIVTHNKIEASELAIGGGVVVDGNFESYGDNVLNRNIVTHNEAHCVTGQNARGGGIATNLCEPILTNNFIYKNYSQGIGGGLMFSRGSGDANKIHIVINNTIYENTASFGGALYHHLLYRTPLVLNSIFWANTAGSLLSISSTELRRNSATWGST